MILLPLVLSLAAAAPPAPVSARAADDKVTVTLVADVTQARAGEPFRVGVRLAHAPGWHSYWKNPGQSGMATEVEWRGEAEIGALVWPAPVRVASRDDFIVTYAHEGDVLLTAPATLKTSGPATIGARVDVLVCKEDCIPGTVLLALPIAVGDTVVPSKDAALFARAEAQVPRPAESRVELDPAGPIAPGTKFTVKWTVAGAPAGARLRGEGAKTAFFPERATGLTLAPKAWKAEGGALVLEIDGTAGPDAPGVSEQPVKAVVVLESAAGEALPLEIAGTLPRASGGAAPARAAPDESLIAAARPPAPPPPRLVAPAPRLPFWPALGLAFLGGLILNLMPCVLPVLALKAGSLASLAGADPRRARAHGLGYTAGVLAAMLALAAVVLGLRAAGAPVAWGFQLQEPIVPAVVGALLVGLAMNAFGVFRVGLGGAATGLASAVGATHGPARALGEGVLAVVLATPCSAPFLGSAVGYALAAPALAALAIFAAVGVGLAAPVALVAAVPALRRFLPRPGSWMIALERAVGFALLGACVWLAWVVGRLTDTTGMTQALALWLGVAVLAWAVGHAQDAGRRWPAALAGAGVVALAVMTLRFAPPVAPTAAVVSGGITWQPWSEAAVAAELEAGRPVFVDFTADWCITCKANERLVIETDAVRRTLATHRVATFRADFTRRHEGIRLALARMGKAGVPMYLVYSPTRPASPAVLPEVLTTDTLVTAIEEASPLSLNVIRPEDVK